MNRYGRSKVLLLFLAVLLAVSAALLAGCSPATESSQAESPQAEGAAAQTSEEEQEAANPSPDAGEDTAGGAGGDTTGRATVEGSSQDGGAVDGTWPVAEVAAEVEPSVVQVNVQAIQTSPFGEEQEAEGLGSGVIYRPDGYIITNNHVIEGAEEVNVAFADGTVEQAGVVGTDAYTDLAVVRVGRDGLPAADFAENLDLRIGELAVAIGSPSGFQSTVSAGVISGLNRDLPPELTGAGEGAAALVDLIQTDAGISPGNSGGALAGENSRVIGINVAYLPPGQTGAENIGFAIPSTTAISVADQLIETGEAEHPLLGVNLTPLTPQVAEDYDLGVESGVLVTNVPQDGPAANAGVEPGDVITAVGGEDVTDPGDVISALRDYSPGETVDLSAVSGGEERQFEVTLEGRN